MYFWTSYCKFVQHIITLFQAKLTEKQIGLGCHNLCLLPVKTMMKNVLGNLWRMKQSTSERSSLQIMLFMDTCVDLPNMLNSIRILSMLTKKYSRWWIMDTYCLSNRIHLPLMCKQQIVFEKCGFCCARTAQTRETSMHKNNAEKRFLDYSALVCGFLWEASISGGPVKAHKFVCQKKKG